jgi:hypothetical protein
LLISLHPSQTLYYSSYLLLVANHILCDDVFFSIFITELQHDKGVQNISGLNNYLVDLLSGIFIDGIFPFLYCNGIFATLSTIVPRFTNPMPELHLLNMRLASLWQSIKHVFANHHIRFKIFSAPHYLHPFNQGVRVRRQCLVSFLILNCIYCINRTRCQYFGHVLPTLKDYMPLDEVLRPPPAVDLGNVWDYCQASSINKLNPLTRS